MVANDCRWVLFQSYLLLDTLAPRKLMLRLRSPNLGIPCSFHYPPTIEDARRSGEDSLYSKIIRASIGIVPNKAQLALRSLKLTGCAGITWDKVQ